MADPTAGRYYASNGGHCDHRLWADQCRRRRRRDRARERIHPVPTLGIATALTLIAAGGIVMLTVIRPGGNPGVHECPPKRWPGGVASPARPF